MSRPESRRQAWALLAACLATTAASAQEATWRCQLEGDDAAEWLRIDPRGGWREWRGRDWSEDLCRSHPAQHCRTDGTRVASETFAIDPDTRGTYRSTERLDMATGAFHRRIVDNTFVLTSGTRVEINSHGRCETGGEPVADAD